jgi:threonine-phosphate decarboxylase
MIEGHGNELAKYKGKIKIDFSSNIINTGTNKEIFTHLSDNLNLISNYPEPDAESLKTELAKHHHLATQNFLVTNGSAEAFYLIASCFNQKQAVIFVPSFAEYQDACIANKLNYKHVSLDKINTKFTNCDLIWLGNPNNPDANVFTVSEIQNLCVNNKNAVVIVDEAYAELCSDFKSSIKLTKQYENLVVIKSLTKLFAIPGLRLGYIIAQEELISKFSKKLIPWSVNALAQTAGKYILKNYPKLKPELNSIFIESKRFQTKLKKIEGIHVYDSVTNYFLVKFEKNIAEKLKQILIEDYGILIRDASNFYNLDTSFIRLATQTREKNNILINILKNWKNLSL